MHCGRSQLKPGKMLVMLTPLSISASLGVCEIQKLFKYNVFFPVVKKYLRKAAMVFLNYSNMSITYNRASLLFICKVIKNMNWFRFVIPHQSDWAPIPISPLGGFGISIPTFWTAVPLISIVYVTFGENFANSQLTSFCLMSERMCASCDRYTTG